jgi:hypothetical protein
MHVCFHPLFSVFSYLFFLPYKQSYSSLPGNKCSNILHATVGIIAKSLETFEEITRGLYVALNETMIW